jgi:hypothetical protein
VSVIVLADFLIRTLLMRMVVASTGRRRGRLGRRFRHRGMERTGRRFAAMFMFMFLGFGMAVIMIMIMIIMRMIVAMMVVVTLMAVIAGRLFIAMGVKLAFAMLVVVMIVMVMIVMIVFVRLLGVGRIGADSLDHRALHAVAMAATARIAVARAAAVGAVFAFFLGLAMGALIGFDQRLPVGDRDLIVIWMDFAEGEEAVPVAAILDEGRLQARLNAHHLGEVDVALELPLGRRLDVEVF